MRDLIGSLRRPLSERLQICLDGSRGTQVYAPGATIRGIVSLRAGADAHPSGARARLLLTLHGRSRCRTTKHGNSAADPATRHHSTFHLFDPDATTEVLLDGPLHAERGRKVTWPFAIAIPLAADGAVLAANQHREASYTPIDGTDQPLPGSFAFAHEDRTHSLETDITYSLLASLTIHTSPKCFKVASLPVLVHPATHAPLADDFHLRTRRHDDDHTFRSYHLVPDVDPPGTLRRLLHPGSVPRLGVRYEVDAPRVIQLDNPAPLPLRMRALPDPARTSGDVEGVSQNIRVNEVCLWVEADTGGRVGKGRCVEDARSSGRIDYRLEKFEGRRHDVYLQLAFGDPTLDLGRIMGMRFYSGVGGLAPAFTALNISHDNHRLSWRISVSFAGQEHKICGSQPVTILPPPWSGPPAPRTALVRQDTLPPPYDFIEQPPEYTFDKE